MEAIVKKCTLMFLCVLMLKDVKERGELDHFYRQKIVRISHVKIWLSGRECDIDNVPVGLFCNLVK